MEKKDKDLLRANTWLSGKTFVKYDVNGAAKALREISDSVYDVRKDDRNISRDYEDQAEAIGLSFDNMTKDQQLAIIRAAGRKGPCYDAFISNAAYQIYTLAKSGSADAEKIAEGFEGCDLERISRFLIVFGDKETEGFNQQFVAIKDRIIESEHWSN